MDAKAPVRVIPVCCARKKAPCPSCGKLGRRKRIHCRDVRTIAYKEIAVLRITYGEYESRCHCCKSFRTHPDDVLPKAKYDNKVRQAVLDGILEDYLNVEAVRRRLQRDFLLDLSTGFVYDCMHDAARQLDMAEHRQQVLRFFSGVLCVDELHLYPRCCWRPTRLATSRWPSPWYCQRPGTHGAVPIILHHNGFETEGCGNRRFDAVPGVAGGTVAQGGASVVRVPRDAGLEQADSRRVTAAADAVRTARDARAVAAGVDGQPRQSRPPLPGRDVR